MTYTVADIFDGTMPNQTYIASNLVVPPKRDYKDVADVLRHARELVADSRQWIKHSMHSYDGAIHRVCLVGAIFRTQAANDLFEQAARLVKQTIWKLYPNFHAHTIESFNDSPITHHGHILRVLDAAIETAEAEAMWNELEAEPKPEPAVAEEKNELAAV